MHVIMPWVGTYNVHIQNCDMMSTCESVGCQLRWNPESRFTRADTRYGNRWIPSPENTIFIRITAYKTAHAEIKTTSSTQRTPTIDSIYNRGKGFLINYINVVITYL